MTKLDDHYDIAWGGYFFEFAPITRRLVPLTLDDGQLINRQTFRKRFRYETNGIYDDPARLTERVAEGNYHITANEIFLIANTKALVEYVPFIRPLEELDAYARTFLEEDPNQLELTHI